MGFQPGPKTSLSQGSIFTGLYPSNHGLIWDDTHLSGSLTTLAEAFSSAGYRTAAFVDGGYMMPKYGFDQGFDSYEVHHRKGLETIGPRVIQYTDLEERVANSLMSFRLPMQFLSLIGCFHRAHRAARDALGHFHRAHRAARDALGHFHRARRAARNALGHFHGAHRAARDALGCFHRAHWAARNALGCFHRAHRAARNALGCFHRAHQFARDAWIVGWSQRFSKNIRPRVQNSRWAEHK